MASPRNTLASETKIAGLITWASARNKSPTSRIFESNHHYRRRPTDHIVYVESTIHTLIYIHFTYTYYFFDTTT